ncbi:probable glycerol-3-phosphate acyltransferase 3 [Rhodamnia argentea]|uniref:Probable glycerol-3-phosphate acyltransferase 3 n=1 Tax=Rhodamnia argentea TaxID=178133 RepID=A0A8B8PCC7_9MYRT|nr:probable glycerol-3-phosphate acyltransferase 3 [Rhodamnia argentea]
MLPEVFFFKSLALFLCRFVLGKLRTARVLNRSESNAALHANFSKYQRSNSLAHRQDLHDQTIVFDVEGVLLRSQSLFPYFMLVAVEAGGLMRALLLLMAYPFLGFCGAELGLEIMVMVCFVGLREESFRVGSAVLPKFLLEDVGLEGFEMVRKRGGKRVGVSGLPQVMVETFLKDYLEVDMVVGRELKVARGYYVGLMERKRRSVVDELEEMLGKEETSSEWGLIGISSYKKSLQHDPLFSRCKEIYLVSKSDKRSWHHLPRENYPKPLIFHDGRLALKPTPISTLAIFIWLPFGLCLSLLRILIGITLPFSLSIPLLCFSGLHLTVSLPTTLNNTNSNNIDNKQTEPKRTKGLLYVCNHRTLLDPLYLSFALKRNFTAVTYSLSRVSEILSPIKTVRLTRNRDEDAETMEKLLQQGDLVICPEGTTCREPYLLRFSPLFSEISDQVVPVALDVHVDMFHGTTAGGLKCFDPLFFFMNPNPSYQLQLLEKVVVSSGVCNNCDSNECRERKKTTRFDKANYVQEEIGKALGFECTKLTRKDKYLILAGNEGIASSRN